MHGTQPPASSDGPYRGTRGLPPHLAHWQLPPDWRWGADGVYADARHYQEIIDALGRSLSLVSVPDPAHAAWLYAEARRLAHRSHPAIPTTYHYWTHHHESGRGPGYLRRWIDGETVGARLRRDGPQDVPLVLRVLRDAGSALAYLHDGGTTHGTLGPDTVWTIPSGRLWLIGWQWALPPEEIPPGIAPDARWVPQAPEWAEGWRPTPASDQWQLGALCFAALVGERPPAEDVPPIQWVRPDVPQSVAEVLDQALSADPARRHHSVAAMLRALDRVVPTRTAIFIGGEGLGDDAALDTEEARLRWATGDDYDVLARIGSGTFGAVWRVRDLALEREVALKMLHEHVARDEQAVQRFRREARLAAQLAHPGIVPIHDWDGRGDVSWYTMELAEGGSVAQLVASLGARTVAEIAEPVDLVLDALAAAHAVGVIHRDLKPENVLVDRYRHWRLADFGIANAMGDDIAGTTGTPQFAAPEQLLGEAQGPGVDCFALAAIVYFVLRGRPPFEGTDGHQVLARQLTGELDVAFAAPAVAEWLRTGLHPDAEQRFQDATVMRHAWRAAVNATDRPVRRERAGRWWRELTG